MTKQVAMSVMGGRWLPLTNDSLHALLRAMFCERSKIIVLSELINMLFVFNISVTKKSFLTITNARRRIFHAYQLSQRKLE